ncbi:hypothetical protein BDY19DRAFT_991893 [Irpex rosettiformis]|uniref:Uncharacterized protein n=1 Tax=Irpex rosettiformis TaxID=378272 RepID=A0ACB8UAQ2_9APHY|nr:hypothetical protein BDY19DRAFT_991893 [Irpex rosettiformis]
MPHFNRHFKRQAGTTLNVGSGDGLGGAVTITSGNTAAASADLILSTGAQAQPVPSNAIPTLAAGFTLTTSDAAAPTSTTDPTPTQASSQAISNSSSLSTGSVVAACVGAFVGLAVLVCIFIWWTRHNSTKRSGGIPRSPMSENRNARGEVDQQKTRSGLWNKLEDGGSGGVYGGRQEEMPTEDEDEKNFSMFKKKGRTMSMRTTRTAKALEEHGFDMPPITKYHPDLAQELAQPERPFAQRQESGVSWDGETVGDDSFLSLRSVRIESGTMSPTGIAKITPPAVAHIHRWESAEVLTLEEASASAVSPSEGAPENPFADVSVERRKSGSNPFFAAGDVHRSTSRRSRSNSRGHSRNPSKTRRSPSRSRIMSQGSQIDPFADLPGSPETARELPSFAHPFHAHTDSLLSSGGTPITSEHAMKSLIAALDLTQEEVEERLRVVSMQPTIDSRYSSVLSGMDDDISRFPKTPEAPPSHH